MISIIVCSINNSMFGTLAKSAEQTIGVVHEIIKIDNTQNTYSIAQAYNLGAKKAKYPYLCFVHEDVFFRTNNWGINLINHFSSANISLVGILGAVVKTKAASGVYIAESNFNRINQLQRTSNNTTDHYYINPYNETVSNVAILDGMFLATTKSNHNKYCFDEQLLKGFHGYDIDYSLGQAANGKVVVIYDVLIEHLSYGGNTLNWVKDQLKVTQKWLHSLPKHIELKDDDILAAEIKNTKTFLNTLFNINYSKAMQFKYLAHLISITGFNSNLFYYVRRFLVYGRFEENLKTSFRKN